MSSGENQGEKKGRGLQVTFNIQVGSHHHIMSPTENHQNVRGNGHYGVDKRICSTPNSGSLPREKRRSGGLPSTKGDNDLRLYDVISGRREDVVPSTLPLEDEDRRPRDIDYSARRNGIPAPRISSRSTVSRSSSGYSYYIDERSQSLDNGKSTLCSRLRSLFGSWKDNHMEEIHEPDPQPREKVEMIPERRRKTYGFEIPPAPTSALQVKSQVEKVQEDGGQREGNTFHEVCTCPHVGPILVSLIKQMSWTNKLKPSCKCDNAFTARLLQDMRESELRRVRKLEQRMDGEELDPNP
jgi:hypothetical protein